LGYVAPEMCEGKPYIGPEVDCWSLGVILFSLVAKKLPFTGSTGLHVYLSSRKGIPDLAPNVSPHCQNLIAALLTYKPQDRATIQNIQDHPWMKPQPALRTPPYRRNELKSLRSGPLSCDAASTFATEKVHHGSPKQQNSRDVAVISGGHRALHERGTERAVQQNNTQTQSGDAMNGEETPTRCGFSGAFDGCPCFGRMSHVGACKLAPPGGETFAVRTQNKAPVHCCSDEGEEHILAVSSSV